MIFAHEGTGYFHKINCIISASFLQIKNLYWWVKIINTYKTYKFIKIMSRNSLGDPEKF